MTERYCDIAGIPAAGPREPARCRSKGVSSRRGCPVEGAVQSKDGDRKKTETQRGGWVSLAADRGGPFGTPDIDSPEGDR